MCTLVFTNCNIYKRKKGSHIAETGTFSFYVKQLEHSSVTNQHYTTDQVKGEEVEFNLTSLNYESEVWRLMYGDSVNDLDRLITTKFYLLDSESVLHDNLRTSFVCLGFEEELNI